MRTTAAVNTQYAFCIHLSFKLIVLEITKRISEDSGNNQVSLEELRDL